MPEDVAARHRAGGLGRLLALRTAMPRHAAPALDAATVEFPLPRTRRRPWALAALAALLLAAATPLAFRDPATPRAAVPLPGVSAPDRSGPPAQPDPSASAAVPRRWHAVRRAAKASPAPSPSSPSPSAPAPARVLLGPATDAELGPLLGSYCRAAHGRFRLAVSTADGWVCARLGRAPIALDMDAMCRWRYGDGARAELGRATDPNSWRCYRDGA